MAESSGRPPRIGRGPNWPGLVMSLAFLAVASLGLTGDPFWLLNSATKWMIAGVVALIGVGMLVTALPRRGDRQRS